MTYEGLFEKCNTLKEAHMLKKELLEKANTDLAIAEIKSAWTKRRWEIRDGWKEHNYA